MRFQRNNITLTAAYRPTHYLNNLKNNMFDILWKLAFLFLKNYRQFNKNFSVHFVKYIFKKGKFQNTEER